MGRDYFKVDAKTFRRALLENGYGELTITGTHASAVSDLQPIHRDPFDRIFVTQAKTEGITLLTADKTIARYGSPCDSFILSVRDYRSTQNHSSPSFCA